MLRSPGKTFRVVPTLQLQRSITNNFILQDLALIPNLTTLDGYKLRYCENKSGILPFFLRIAEKKNPQKFIKE